MKSYKALLKKRTQAIIGLFFLTISINTITKQRAASLQTPQQSTFKEIQKKKETVDLLPTMVDPALLKHHIAPQVLAPVIKHLRTEIAKKNIFHATTLVGHPAKITNSGFSKNGKTLVTSCEGDKDNLIIWDVEKAQKLHAISVPISSSNEKVKYVNPSPGGSKVIAIATTVKKDETNHTEKDTGPKLTLWNTKKGKQINQFSYPQEKFGKLEWSFNGKRIVFSIHQKDKATIYIADGNTGNIIATHSIAEIPYWKLNPYGNTMVIASKKKQSNFKKTLYNLTTGKIIKELEGSINKFTRLSYSADGKKIIARDISENAFVWDSKTGKSLATFSIPGVGSSLFLNSDATKGLTQESFNDNRIFVWDAVHGSIIKTFDAKTPIKWVEFSPDNTIIAAKIEDNLIGIWNITSGKRLFTTQGDNVTFSSDSKKIQTHIEAKKNETKCSVTLWNLTTEKQIKTFVAEHHLFETTPNFYNVVLPDDTNDHNFILWTPYTQKERETFAKMNDLPLQQANYLYQLHSKKLAKLPISTANSDEFKALPAEIQNMITSYYLSPSTGLSYEQQQAVKSAPTATQNTQGQSWWQWIKTGWW